VEALEFGAGKFGWILIGQGLKMHSLRQALRGGRHGGRCLIVRGNVDLSAAETRRVE